MLESLNPRLFRYSSRNDVYASPVSVVDIFYTVARSDLSNLVAVVPLTCVRFVRARALAKSGLKQGFGIIRG